MAVALDVLVGETNYPRERRFYRCVKCLYEWITLNNEYFTVLHTPHNTTDVPTIAAPNATILLVERHLAQVENKRIRVTFTDLDEHGLFFPLKDILIRPVHINYAARTGRAEPTLLAGSNTVFAELGYFPILPYIHSYPYIATSRLLYSYDCGDSRCIKLGRIFTKDTQFLRDTVSTIDAMWAKFESEFPFHDLAELFLEHDWHNFVLSTQLYNAMHEFYYGNRQHAWRRLHQMLPDNAEADMVPNLTDNDNAEVEIPNLVVMVSQLAALGFGSGESSSSDSSSVRSINRISSGPRLNQRCAKRTRTTPTVPASFATIGPSARNELDTRADTICCGKNFRTLVLTGQTCEVKGFHDSLASISDVPIASNATAWTSEAGETYILIFHESLTFGHEMDHSLINPNQVRSYGIPVWDNPYDPDKRMGIDAGDFHVPFLSEGSTIFFESHYPTDFELENCPHIELTSDREWDPHNVPMPGSNKSADVDEVKTQRFVQQVDNNRANATNRDWLRYESDFVLGSMGETIEQDMAERIVSQVNVWKTKSQADIDPVVRSANELVSTTRHSKITPELISRLFVVGIPKAKEMLEKTTQKGIRQAIHPLTRRYRVDHLNLHRNELGGQWTLDHLESRIRSIRGNTGAFTISNGNFVEAYAKPAKDQYQAADALRRFCKDIGIPVNLKTDMAGSFEGRHTVYQEVVRKNHINHSYAEAGRKNQLQQVDVAIRELKKRWQSKMVRRNVPKRAWCFGLEHQAKMMQFIPRGRNERTGYEQITGKTPDISEYCDFDFYDLVWYWPNTHPPLTTKNRELARWVGVAHRIGSDMCYWLLPKSGKPIADTTVQHVTAEDLRDSETKKQVDDFDTELTQRLDDTHFTIVGTDNFYLEIFMIKTTKLTGTARTTPSDAEYNSPEAKPDIDDIKQYDKLFGATFMLDPKNGDNKYLETKATVKRRVADHSGNAVA